jgi:hypothetical protein
LLRQNLLDHPETFIHPVPHISFVWGAENVAFLRKRVEALRAHPLFADMEYSENFDELKTWMPLAPQSPEQMRDAMTAMFRLFTPGGGMGGGGSAFLPSATSRRLRDALLHAGSGGGGGGGDMDGGRGGPDGYAGDGGEGGAKLGV